MMIFFKQAAMRECEEGVKVLEYIKAHPGTSYRSEQCEDRYLRDEINEGGGSVWWCDVCDHMCSPNRPCGCGDDDWYGFYDDAGVIYSRHEHEQRIERQLLNGRTFWQAERDEALAASERSEYECLPELAFWVKVSKSAKPYLLEVY